MIEKGGLMWWACDKITYHGRKYSAFDINKPNIKTDAQLLEQIKHKS
jgi:hypothetical protein